MRRASLENCSLLHPQLMVVEHVVQSRRIFLSFRIFNIIPIFSCFLQFDIRGTNTKRLDKNTKYQSLLTCMRPMGIC